MNFVVPLPWAGPVAEPASALAIAQAADDLGFDQISVGEHLFYTARMVREGIDPADMAHEPRDEVAARSDFIRQYGATAHLDAFTLLAFIASRTRRVKLRLSIINLPYHHPFDIAKRAATLDYLSNGRVILGVGVGWLRDEFRILNVPYAERGAIADESLAIIKALFSDDPRHEGKYYTFEALSFEPKPVQKPFPIWIGGASDAALRRVARFGTGWTPSSLTPAEQAKRLPRLEQLLEAQGRSLAEIRIAGSKVGNGWAGGKPPDAGAVLEQVRQWEAIGVDSVAVNLGGLATPAATLVERMQWFAENVMPAAIR